MEDWSPESRALYEILTREAYETRFLDHKKEVLDAVRIYVDDTSKQLRNVNDSINSVHATMGEELEAVKAAIGVDLESVKGKLSAEISQLASSLDRAIRLIPTSTSGGPSDRAAGPVGHRDEHTTRGLACVNHQPPPAAGTNYTQNFSSLLNLGNSSSVTDPSASAPRVELPQFEGVNSRLW